VCLWFLARNKNPGGGWRDRRGEVLFIDARKMGVMVDRVRRELTDADIATIADTYHGWRGEPDAPLYADVQGFAKAATLDDVRTHGYVLTPGRFVGAADDEGDGLSFDQRFAPLAAALNEQFGQAEQLAAAIREKLSVISIDA